MTSLCSWSHSWNKNYMVNRGNICGSRLSRACTCQTCRMQSRMWGCGWKKHPVLKTICKSSSSQKRDLRLLNSTQPATKPGALGSTTLSVCVCVSVGEDLWCLSLLSRIVSCLFWLVSARHCLEASFVWIHSDLSEVSVLSNQLRAELCQSGVRVHRRIRKEIGKWKMHSLWFKLLQEWSRWQYLYCMSRF